MKSVTEFTAEEILAIPKNRPDKLFNAATLSEESKKFFSIWHPDRSKHDDATKVFQKIKELKELGLEQLGLGEWQGPNELVFKDSNKKVFKFKYRIMHNFELGKMYIAKTKVLYFIKPEFDILFNNALRQLTSSLKFTTPDFKDAFKIYFPNIVFSGKNEVGELVLVVDKSTEMLLLKDLLNFMPDNKLPVKHVAWVISSLLNSLCYLNYIGLNHNAISSNSMFINPSKHSIHWLGGWWYTTAINDRLLALPQEIISILPSKLMSDKESKVVHNLTAIRALGLECLGDKTKVGSVFLKNPEIPAPILTWLRSSPPTSSVEDYELWGEALTSAWGKRKFIDLNIDINQIY